MNKDTLKLIDKLLENLANTLDTLNTIFETFVQLADKSPVEDAIVIRKVISLVIEHMSSSIAEAQYSLNPVTNSSKEYTR